MLYGGITMAQKQYLEWGKNFGGLMDDYATGVATDLNGNVYQVGYFASSSITFGSTTLTRVGSNYDAYIVKYNASGTVLWAKDMGDASNASNYSFRYSVATDANGNVYFTGGSGWENSSISSATSTTTKFDSDGNVLWTNPIGGSALAIDVNGNAYIAGEYTTPSITIGSFTLNNPPYNNKISSNTYVMKLDPTGTVVYAKGFGNSNCYDHMRSLAVDANGNAYFVQISRISAAVSGSCTKLNASGNTTWSKSINNCNSVSVDGSNNVYVCGSFVSTLTVDAVTLTNPSSSICYPFMLKIDANGTAIWGYTNNSNYTEGQNIKTDAFGNLFLQSYFVDGNTNYNSFKKYDSNRNLLWSKTFPSGAGYSCSLNFFDLDSYGNIYLTGYFQQKTLALPGSSTTLTNLSNAINSYYYKDIFLAKYTDKPTASSNSPACVGQVLTLSATTIDGATYSWSGPNGFSSTQQNPTVSTNATSILAGNYIVKATVNSIVRQADTAIVTINSYPIAPTATSSIGYCKGAIANQLSATGTSLKWYTVSTGGTGSSTAPTPSTANVGVVNYYVSQSTGTCESPRAQIAVTTNAIPVAPVVTDTINYCQYSSSSQLTATGSSLKWYTTSSGGTGSSTAPTPSTSSAGYVNYYVSQSVNTCESPRAKITTYVNNATTPVPSATNISYCQNNTATALSATGSNLLWYTVSTNGIGSSTAPIPSTSNVGTTSYYVSQTNKGCESGRTQIDVTINSSPTAQISGTTAVCKNATAPNITFTGADGTAPYTFTYNINGGSNQTVSTTSGNSVTVSVPTSTAGAFAYNLVSVQDNSSSQCSQVQTGTATVTINALPTAQISGTIAVCKDATAPNITFTGANGTAPYIFTYNINGGSNLTATTTSGNSVNVSVPTNTAGSFAYNLVSVQDNSSTQCTQTQSGSATVTVNAIPSAPTAVPTYTYCQNSTATQLTATGSNLLWYTVPTNGTSSSTVPTPSTSSVGTANYYVSQTINGCESPRTQIDVTTNTQPSAPSVTSAVSYCQNAQTTVLSANGSNLLWYTVSTNGTGSSTAPSPTTSNVGTVNYYVSQTTGNCESPRAQIAVTVNAIPTTPVVSQVGSDLMSSVLTGNQWYNLNGLIQGATQFVYSPTSNGYYYTIVTQNGCNSANSNILHYIATGIDNANSLTGLHVYPNPMLNELNIELKDNTSTTQIELLNIAGEVVYKGAMMDKITIPTTALSSGVYVLRIENSKGVEYRKIVK